MWSLLIKTIHFVNDLYYYKADGLIRLVNTIQFFFKYFQMLLQVLWSLVEVVL